MKLIVVDKHNTDVYCWNSTKTIHDGRQGYVWQYDICDYNTKNVTEVKNK